MNENDYKRAKEYAELDEYDEYKANLSGADLSGANLSNANLSGADLTNANLGGADLKGAWVMIGNVVRKIEAHED